MSERNVLKLDQTNLKEFQKKLHRGTPENPNINSRFSYAIQKYGWSSHTKVKMSHTAEEGEVVYTASKKYDFLLKCEMIHKLFSIKVKDGYKNRVQICFPHNLGHNIGYKGELRIDDDAIEKIDSIWMDIHSQYYMKPNKREHYNRMIGNISVLEDWTTELPPMTLIVPQPFSYSRRSQVGLPLLKSSTNTITHVYSIRTKLTDILRMRARKDKNSEFKEIKCNLNYLQDVPTDLPIPELWGTFAQISEEEFNWRKSIDENTGEPFKQSIYLEDVVMISSDNPVSLSQTDVIPLQCKDPCKQYFWVANNVKNSDNRNFSNYTTDTNNLFNGWNPCSKMALKYGGSSRVQELDHEHFELSVPWNSFPSAPCEPGYNGATFGFEPGTLQADTAVVLDSLNATIHITLNDTNPFNVSERVKEQFDEDGELIPFETMEDSNIEENSDKYNIHIRLLTTKKLDVYWSEKEKKLKYEF